MSNKHLEEDKTVNSETDLTARKVVLLRDVIRTALPVSMSMLRTKMAELGIPVVLLGERKSGILLTDLAVGGGEARLQGDHG